MAALLLLDLDNTLADREAAFLAWAQAKAHEWGLEELRWHLALPWWRHDGAWFQITPG